VNRCGVEDGTTFSGNSRVFGPDGETLASLGLQPELHLLTLDPAVLRRRRAAVPMLRDERLDVTLGNLERIARERYVL
jgi:predicted amidohydrolase